MWMRKQRDHLNISLAELADRLTSAGVSRTGAAIGNWEANDHVPLLAKPDQARALAEALEMSISDMMIAAGYDLDLKVEDFDVPASFVAFMERYNQLTRDEQNIVSRVLDVFCVELVDLRQHVIDIADESDE